jgi:hypothetical protein
MKSIKHMTIEEAADEAAGNWTKFEAFWWKSEKQPEDSENWMLYSIRHRDSDLLTQSNAIEIEKQMEPFIKSEDAFIGNFGHFLVGWIDHLAVRVKNSSGKVTDAFKKLYELMVKMEDYPVLNEEHWSEMEDEDTHKNVLASVKSVAPNMKNKYINRWAYTVQDMMRRDNLLDPVDGFGGYAEDSVVAEYLKKAGYKGEINVQ